MTNNNLPLRGFVKDGVIDFKKLAQEQMMNTQEGTDTYKRYEQYWKRLGGSNGSNVVPLRSKRKYSGGTVTGGSQPANEEGLQEGSKRPGNHTCGDDEVWIGIKFSDEETHYTLRDLRGDSIKAEDLGTIKEDIAKHEDFELRCWTKFIGKDIQNMEELYDEIAHMLDIPIDKVRGARVDSDYDEDKGDVIISFKACITRSVG